MKQVIVFIHGVTLQDDRSGYSDKFAKILKGRTIIEFNWSNLINPWQRKVLGEYKEEKGFITKALGTPSLMTVGDALSYHKTSSRVLLHLHRLIEPYTLRGYKVIFITHSLGTLIALDYMKTHMEIYIVDTKMLVSMGLNLGVFLDKPLEMKPFDWHIFNEKNDALGWSNKVSIPFVTYNHKYKSKSLNPFKRYTWASHNSYWASKSIAKTIKGLL